LEDMKTAVHCAAVTRNSRSDQAGRALRPE